jgi:hypothetical protein
MFIDENTSRDDLLTAVCSTNLLQECIDRDIDPEALNDADLLKLVREWIEAGDECGGA